MKKTHNVFSIGLLLFLILIASCSVRKGIQVALDVPVSKQLNPSKTHLSAGDRCAFHSVDDVLHASVEVTIEPSTNSALITASCATAPYYSHGNANTPQPLSFRSPTVPLYIRFQSLKVWMS